LAGGDDFVQWTLRFGCVLHDAGPMRGGLSLILERDLWPDPERKLSAVAEQHRELVRLVQMGDEDAARDQLRATLTTLARGLLLRARIFPLARDELSGQLRCLGDAPLADQLESTIHGRPRLREIHDAMTTLKGELGPLPGSSGWLNEVRFRHPAAISA